MQLKHLEIQGFKSFPDKTRISFGKGLTAVVGPNGSGKSNISDAVRWVMGEQSTKTLRGDKMEDVIFTGTKTRKSQGFAEVSLTIDNTAREFAIDSDEVTITRRYDRSGESEYMINRGVVRLKDIQEFLMDTGLGKDGYSLVGQGKIAEIVQSKSGERREIFEEAAGISKYRYRKKEAERNLVKAEDNLVRLRDVLSELEVRVEPLKEQSEKAKKFLELAQEKKTLEVSLWLETLERSNRLLKDQGDKILACSVSCEEIEQALESVEEQIQLSFSDGQQCTLQNEALRKEKEALEQELSEESSKIAVLLNDTEHNLQTIDRLQSEISAHMESGDFVKNEIEEKQKSLGVLDSQIEAHFSVIEEKKAELLEKSEEGDSFTLQVSELSNIINEALIEQSQKAASLESLRANLISISESEERFEAALLARSNELSEYKTEENSADELIKRLNAESEQLQNTSNGHKIKLENRANKLSELRSECDSIGLSIREKEQKITLLENMEQSLDGYAFSVKEVMKRAHSGALQGVLGTVSQILSAKEEYATAIEIALGGSMQNIVVETEGNAKAAIRALKDGNLGRATFLPLTSVSGNSISTDGLDRYAGFIDLASNLVEYDNKFEPIIMSLLARTVVVDDIDTAVLIAQKNGYRFKIVTLDGQVVNAGGSLTGGSKNKGQSFLSRRNEINTLKEEVKIMTGKLSEKQGSLSVLGAEVSKIEAEHNAILSEIATVNEDKIRVEGEKKRLSQMQMQTSQIISSIETDIVSQKARLEMTVSSISEAEASLSSLDTLLAQKTSELSGLRESGQSVLEHKSALAEEISGLNIQGITLKKDREMLVAAIEELSRRKEETGGLSQKLEDEINTTKLRNEEINKQIEVLKSDSDDKREKTIILQDEMQKALQRRQEFEAKSTVLRKESREISERKEKLVSEMARLEERKQQLSQEFQQIIAKLWDEYELTRSEAQEIAIEISDISKATTELNSLRGKIRSLGSVNVGAIEEYAEVFQRYEFLSRQVEDAEKARAELLRLIGELTSRMRDIFAENFEKINMYFQEIFVELFGGGSACLKLTDPDDLLESGIEIQVEPPGKIIKNLTLLSGGEQAFVAIAIYFAIFKVRPAPFCILDEIEAALDDVNVDKYATYLKSICDKTQFIMITHRRGSMEAADVLYGVTMQDQGVSKLLELNVSQIEETLNMRV